MLPELKSELQRHPTCPPVTSASLAARSASCSDSTSGCATSTARSRPSDRASSQARDLVIEHFSHGPVEGHANLHVEASPGAWIALALDEIGHRQHGRRDGNCDREPDGHHHEGCESEPWRERELGDRRRSQQPRASTGLRRSVGPSRGPDDALPLSPAPGSRGNHSNTSTMNTASKLKTMMCSCSSSSAQRTSGLPRVLPHSRLA